MRKPVPSLFYFVYIPSQTAIELAMSTLRVKTPATAAVSGNVRPDQKQANRETPSALQFVVILSGIPKRNPVVLGTFEDKSLGDAAGTVIRLLREHGISRRAIKLEGYGTIYVDGGLCVQVTPSLFPFEDWAHIIEQFAPRTSKRKRWR